MAMLEILNGPQAGERVSIVQDTFFIGRDANNHLVLAERTVSRKHAVINHLEKEYTVSDLKSLKGLLINGEKRSEAALQNGDEVTLGAVRLRFYDDPGAPATSAGNPLKRKGIYFLILLACAVAAVFAGRHFFVEKDDIALHYSRGIELYNLGKDREGARREWETVLNLDPQKKTVFGQKAAQLLENLRKR